MLGRHVSRAISAWPRVMISRCRMNQVPAKCDHSLGDGMSMGGGYV